MPLLEQKGFLKPTPARKGGRAARPSFVGMYDFNGTLGEGKYSVVKLATHVLSKQKVAVKVIDKTKLNEVELAHLHHEVMVMKLLRNPHVVRLYEIVDTSNWLYLIMELGDGGDMYHWLRKHKGNLTDSRARAIFAQLVIALGYCHKHRVAHRDLKPENVIFYLPKEEGWHGEEVVKVTDFGLSNSFKDTTTMMETWCGSLAYSAPEVLIQQPYLGPKADIWGLGIILYMLLCYDHPFQGHDENDTLYRIMDVRYKFPDKAGPEFRDLVDKMIQKEPRERIELTMVEEHEWMQDEKSGQSAVALWREREKVFKFGNEAVASGDALSQSISSLMTKEEHKSVVTQMCQFDIAESDIDAALVEGSYNYVSSTYCLLAEKQLKMRKRARRDRGLDPGSKGSPVQNRALSDDKQLESPASYAVAGGTKTPTPRQLPRSESDKGTSTDPTSATRARPRRPGGISLGLRPRNRPPAMSMTRWVSDESPSADKGRGQTHSLNLTPYEDDQPLSAGIATTAMRLSPSMIDGGTRNHTGGSPKPHRASADSAAVHRFLHRVTVDLPLDRGFSDPPDGPGRPGLPDGPGGNGAVDGSEAASAPAFSFPGHHPPARSAPPLDMAWSPEFLSMRDDGAGSGDVASGPAEAPPTWPPTAFAAPSVTVADTDNENDPIATPHRQMWGASVVDEASGDGGAAVGVDGGDVDGVGYDLDDDDDTATLVGSDSELGSETTADASRHAPLDEERPLSSSLGGLDALCEEDEEAYVEDADVKVL
mmetsp:Transcript_5966/g.15196  ORF Transcript_5966/g.15196 Transcript_5966/m.15196 type:complete len:765 (-) Transcript_5966:54-2348(-)|eukprot:CAMPEP_0182944072 /NCGR_PEP_ID=MMETSP0105_2-20130417/53371_1 /TAXON_ID=81532 ORGANISM="Acanthoeca-like sp., Strain 10tr" /NCGR_SAMPLE_ID=MMETSP0105_2 /ASSEMBLY_ACC=CAM_ASM_000205 /LENGTH=764 /DNA_ID=CAMNT_0025083975 /DNA_START=81 /DNA_END=2375 /DNA_ORIENTATION=+